MNMQIAATIRPVVMFLRAKRLFMAEEEYLPLALAPGASATGHGGHGYRCTSATIAQNSSAR